MPGSTLLRAALAAPVCALLLGWGPAHADPVGGPLAPGVILVGDDDDDRDWHDWRRHRSDDDDDREWRDWRRDRLESRRDRRDWREDFFDRRADYFDRRGWGHRRGWGPPWFGQEYGGYAHPYWQGRHWRDLREHPSYRYGHQFDRRRGGAPWWR